MLFWCLNFYNSGGDVCVCMCMCVCVFVCMFFWCVYKCVQISANAYKLMSVFVCSCALCNWQSERRQVLCCVETFKRDLGQKRRGVSVRGRTCLTSGTPPSVELPSPWCDGVTPLLESGAERGAVSPLRTTCGIKNEHTLHRERTKIAKAANHAQPTGLSVSKASEAKTPSGDPPLQVCAGFITPVLGKDFLHFHHKKVPTSLAFRFKLGCWLVSLGGWFRTPEVASRHV